MESEEITDGKESVKGEETTNSEESVKGEETTNHEESVKGEETTNHEESVNGEEIANNTKKRISKGITKKISKEITKGKGITKEIANGIKDILNAYTLSGGRPNDLKSKDAASMIIEGNKIIDSNAVEGLIIEKKETKTGAKIKIIVKAGNKIKKPMHVCFGVLPAKGLQEIVSEIIVEENAALEIKACCTFPNAEEIKHIMDAKIILEKNSSLIYHETHFHGSHGGIDVMPKSKITVGENSTLKTSFSLITGRVGKLDIDYDVDAKNNSVTEILTRVYGKDNDDIRIREAIKLNGEHARSVIKSRIAIKDNAVSEVINITEGNAAHTWGHVDCTEIIRNNAKAKAIPIVSLRNETAKVTHEAAIGTVDKKELETLMAHGLECDEAVDMIIEGLLKD